MYKQDKIGCILAFYFLSLLINVAFTVEPGVPKDKWLVKETEIAAPKLLLNKNSVGESREIHTAISEDGLHSAYSIIGERDGVPSGVDLYGGMVSDERSDKWRHYVYKWIVDSLEVELTVDTRILTELFNGTAFFDHIDNSGIMMVDPGRFLFSKNGNDWLLVVQCRVPLKSSPYQYDGTKADVLMFWVNGRFIGARGEISNELRISEVVFNPIRKQVAVICRSDGDPNRTRERQPFFILVDYSSDMYDNKLTDSGNTVGKDLNEKDTDDDYKQRTRLLGLKKIISTPFEALDVGLHNNEIDWAVAFPSKNQFETDQTNQIMWRGGSFPFEWRGESLKVLPNRGVIAVRDFISINGKPQKKFEKILGWNVSPDGNHYIAIVQELGETFALVDNQPIKLPKAKYPESLVVSIDNNAKWRILGETHFENGEVRNEYLWTSNIVENENPSLFAFLAVKLEPLKGQVGGLISAVIVKDGAEKPLQIEKVKLLDGIDYLVEVMGKTICLSRNRDAVLSWNPPIKENGQDGNEGTFVRLNGIPVGGKRFVLHPSVSPSVSDDGQDVCFVARTAGEWKLFINGEEIVGYDEVSIDNSAVAFNSKGNLIFFAERGGSLFQVEVTKNKATID